MTTETVAVVRVVCQKCLPSAFQAHGKMALPGLQMVKGSHVTNSGQGDSATSSMEHLIANARPSGMILLSTPAIGNI